MVAPNSTQGAVERTAAHRTPASSYAGREPKIRIEGVSYWYSRRQMLNGVTLSVPDRAVTVLFGPAGGGKTTLMRLVNRLNDLVEDTQMTGRILLDGEDIYTPGTDITGLRRRVGMVFALPLPLPGTVRENVVYGPRLAGERNTSRLSEIVERSLTQAALWTEVRDRLDAPARDVQERPMHRQKHVSVGFAAGPAHPPAELIEIRHPEPVGPVNEDRIDVWNVYPAFNYRRA